MCVSGLISTKKMCIQHSLWKENMHSFGLNLIYFQKVLEAILFSSNKNNVGPKLNIRSDPKTVTHILVPALPPFFTFSFFQEQNNWISCFLAPNIIPILNSKHDQGVFWTQCESINSKYWQNNPLETSYFHQTSFIFVQGKTDSGETKLQKLATTF